MSETETESQEQPTTEDQQEGVQNQEGEAQTIGNQEEGAQNQEGEAQDQETGGVLNQTIKNMLNGIGNEDTLKAQIELVNKMTLRAHNLIDQTTADDLVMIAKTLEILGGKTGVLKVAQVLMEASKQIEADKTEALKQIEVDKTEALKQIEADKTEALLIAQNFNSLLYHENHGLTTV